MKNKIYIGVAWPYANGSLHLGHIAGCYLPADIFARFNRLKNNDVLMVSGSDEHGTPITLLAEQENTTPQKIVDRYNKEHTDDMERMGISFDLFTRTTTDNHEEVVQDVFLNLYKKGHIYKKFVDAFYCNSCKRYLPDRYIEGKCANCGNENARGDQCDECGNILDPQELLSVKCKICGSIPEIKNSEHFFLALSKFESKLNNWIKNKQHWKSSVLKFTQNWLNQGLNDRAITRDINWGVKVPLDGYEQKRIYVWFEAVIGYLSASIEWSKSIGETSKWEDWWKNNESKHFYFLAKDNIPFHSIIWPSILMGYDEKLNLPDSIPANEYLRLKGEQFSKSRGVAVYVPDMLDNFDPDPIRYYLSINMPENKDTNWTWNDFIVKNNDELVGTYGNFIHRVITFTSKNFGQIPDIGKLDKLDQSALEKIEDVNREVGTALSSCNFKKGLKSAMSLAHFGNYYFDQKKPWLLIKDDKEKCSTSLHICFKIVNALIIFMYPYLPFSSNKLWKNLGNKTPIKNGDWKKYSNELNIGVKIEKPIPLFKKIVIGDIMTDLDPISKIDLCVAKIIDVKDHPQADKLYILHVNLGDIGERVIVAGMKPYYTKDEIKGKTIVMVINLKPAKIRGIESKGMLLAATDSNGLVSLINPGEATPGSKIFIKGIPGNPDKILEFDDFLKINMIIDENQEVIYNGKKLQSEKGNIFSDKKVKEGAKIS